MAISAAYGEYLAASEQIMTRWDELEAGTSGHEGSAVATRAWADYLDNMALWRSLPYMDPCLPAEVLPPEWPGSRARERFIALESRLRDRALTFFRSRVTVAPDGSPAR